MADETKYPTRIAPYGLRMPDDLKARVQAAADENNRSMNAEIVAALEEKYPPPKNDFRAILEQLIDLLADMDAPLKVIDPIKEVSVMLKDMPDKDAEDIAYELSGSVLKVMAEKMKAAGRPLNFDPPSRE